MPSPFPGMDPFLEAPGLWPDVHHRLATVISENLNGALPRPYYATMEMRAELGIVAQRPDGNGHESRKRVIPDVLVLKHRDARQQGQGGVAVLEAPARGISANIEFEDLSDEPARDYFVEIRDAARGHKLVTLIEILSHANKRRGLDRDAYRAKQAKILESDVNLVEIDLLRDGERVLATEHLAAGMAQISPPPDYLVLVSRADKRGPRFLGYAIYPITVRDALPCIALPLGPDDPAIAFDLQSAFDRVYDTGPYRRGAVDYSAELDPPLSGDDMPWLAERLRSRAKS